MGLLKSLKKAVKKVVGGVKKIFKKVTKFIGKIVGSKWGKALLLAASVFTLGTAAMAGFQGFGASQATSFFGKFVDAGGAFMKALANPVASAKSQLGIGAEAGGFTGQAVHAAGTAEQAGQAAGMLGEAGQVAKGVTSAADLAASGIGTGAQATTNLVLDPNAIRAVTQGAGAVPGAAAPAGGFLSRAAGVAGKVGSGIMDFAKSTGGGQVLGKVIEGYATGAAEEERMKEEERVRRYYDEQWRDPAKLAQLQGAVGDLNVPGGYLDRARRVNQFLNDRQYAYPSGPTDPDLVASYARG